MTLRKIPPRGPHIPDESDDPVGGEKDQQIADLQAKLEAAERERDALRASACEEALALGQSLRRALNDLSRQTGCDERSPVLDRPTVRAIVEGT